MFQRVLLATDFSEHARCAYRWALGLAKAGGGRIHLVHAVEEDFASAAPMIGAPLPGEVVDMARYREEFREASTGALEKEADRLRAEGVEVQTHLLTDGRAWQTITAAADDLDCSVIVLATHGRSGLAQLLIGSTTEKVVRHAKCPVLTVHQGDRGPD
ncbi:MAG TPA: universal stress protein [Planctomycetota bacterium]